MATICDKDLNEALYNYTVKIMKNSNPYTTKESISRKVLQDCADALNLDMNIYNNKNIMYIHPDNMQKIDSKWQNLMDRGIKLSHEEQNVYKLLKSSEFVNILDVQKFFNILSSKDEDEFLFELLAVDGFQGISEMKNYVENLKIGDEGSDHVHVIREIYRKFRVPVKVVYYALLQIYEPYTTDNDVQKLITNIKDELADKVTDYDIDAIIDMYKDSFSELKPVALTKLAQLKNLKKKSKAIKRHLQIAVKESNKKSKSKKQTEE